MQNIIPLTELSKQAFHAYDKYFGKCPELCVFAPGRVNLIGEHTDYNDGFVFPMAIPLVTVITGSKSDQGVCKIVTTCSDADDPKSIEFSVSEMAKLCPGLPKWANYIKGVVALHPQRGSIPAFNALIASSIPCGSGLSSSAALEIAMFTFLDDLMGIQRSTDEHKKLKATKCQQAEHQFANVPCGIMDQFISSLALENHAILIDCRSLEVKSALFDSDKVAILITNSNVKHELSSGQYALRKQQCEMAAKALEKSKLRDATPADLEKLQDFFDDVCYRRARHVISENERCRNAYVCLQNKNYAEFGALMNESHKSLRDDYEVSCPELDQLVSLAAEVSGVYGSRMTGGGFGGCTVTLLAKNSVEDVVEHVKANYSGKPEFYWCCPFAGAGNVALKDIMD